MKQDIASAETDAEIMHEWRRSVAPALAELRKNMIDYSFPQEGALALFTQWLGYAGIGWCCPGTSTLTWLESQVRDQAAERN